MGAGASPPSGVRAHTRSEPARPPTPGDPTARARSPSA